MIGQKDTERRLQWGAVLAMLVLVNVIGISVFGRIDATGDKEFTLSQASQKALAQLKEPVTVRAYFSRDLPPPHASQARYVKDLLDSFYARGHGKFRYEFIDPQATASAEEADRKNALRQDVFGNTVREATAMERELESIGIPPVQMRVNQADKLEVKRAYMGLALTSGSRREVIPVVSDTAGLEYDITSALRKMGKTKAQTVAVVTGHGGTRATEEMGQALAALREHYEVGEVDLAQAGTLLPEADALLVVGPQTPLTDAEQVTLRAYMHAGHPVGFFLPPAKANLPGLSSVDNAHGLAPLLAELGVQIDDAFVLDAQCATINVQKQQGFMRFSQPVRYPFVAQRDQLEASSVTQGLGGVLLPFAAPVRTIEPATGGANGAGALKRQVWARSSAQSWLQPKPYNLDALQRWTPDPQSLQQHDLIVALEGKMGRVQKPEGSAAESDAAPAEAVATRAIVAGTDALLLDPFLGKSNEALALNMVDWLLGDDDLLAVRRRGMAAAPLADVGEGRRRMVKYGNIVGLPAAFVALGAGRWRRRQRRRHEAMRAFAQED